MRERVRIGLLGAGLVGQRHAAAILRSDCAALAGVVDPHNTVDGTQHFPSLDAMLRHVDGVIVATPNMLHVEHGLACVAAGVPALIEKPIASDTVSARAIVDTAEAADVPILVGHHRRYNPLIAGAKRQIETGELGRIVSVHAFFWLFKPDDYFAAGDWRTRKGAGPVFINLIHDIDLLRHLVGEIAEVQSLRSSAVRGFEVEDTAVIVLRFVTGALGTVNVSDTIAAPWSWELTAGENPAYPHTGEGCYWIGGTHGSLELPGHNMWTYSGHRSWWEKIACNVSHAKNTTSGGFARENPDPLDLQISHFARVISGEEPPLVSGREGLRSLAVVEAIARAAETGRTVAVPD